MSDKFKNKYRTQSSRLQHWNYSWNAAYFITICTKDKKHYFGKIVDNEMQSSNIGVIADVFLSDLRTRRENVEFPDFVIMPNHVHALIVIGGDPEYANPTRRDKARLVSTKINETPNLEKTIGQQRFQNQGKNTISSIIGSYKSAVTKHARRLGHDFEWQSRFHDHIIRDENSFDEITEYIENNPLNWHKDKFYSL